MQASELETRGCKTAVRKSNSQEVCNAQSKLKQRAVVLCTISTLDEARRSLARKNAAAAGARRRSGAREKKQEERRTRQSGTQKKKGKNGLLYDRCVHTYSICEKQFVCRAVGRTSNADVEAVCWCCNRRGGCAINTVAWQTKAAGAGDLSGDSINVLARSQRTPAAFGDALRVVATQRQSMTRVAGGACRRRRKRTRNGVGRLPSRSSRIVIWLILPVVICLSQRLSHASVSTSSSTVKLRMAH